MIRVHRKKQTANTVSEEKTVGSIKVTAESEACEKKPSQKRASATSAALRILQSGANSSLMLREKLSRKGYSRDEVEEALDEVQHAGLLDDRGLLFAHAEYLAVRKCYGKRRVYIELVRKFDRPLVEAYFEEAVEEIDFSACCLAFAKKNSKGINSSLAAKLSQRGYAASEIRYALSSLSSEQEDQFT